MSQGLKFYFRESAVKVQEKFKQSNSCKYNRKLSANRIKKVIKGQDPDRADG